MKQSSKQRVIYILWSGGLDSTFLIQHLLDQDPKAKVIAGYVEILNNDVKTPMELRAVKRLAQILKSKYQDRFEWRKTVYKCEVAWCTDYALLYQPPIWIHAAMVTCPGNATEVAIGYVMGDCAISYLSEIRAIFKAYSGLCQTPFPKLTFPLMKWDKTEIVDRMDPLLKPHIVWCERPEGKNFKPCGTCPPCKRSPIRTDFVQDYYVTPLLEDLEKAVTKNDNNKEEVDKAECLV